MSSLDPKNRSRSPRFPSQNLEDSIRLAQMIYDAVHRSPVDSDTAFRLMGFSGKTGTSAKALASLRQYGLIEGFGENTRVTDLALAIYEPANERERIGSIYTASRSPDVFVSVFDRFDDRIPQADEPIRAYLIRELGFQKNSADELIRSLRQSVGFADAQGAVPELSTTETTETSNSDSEASITDGETIEHSLQAQRETRQTVEPTQSASIPLTKDCRAEVAIYGELTPKAVSNLIRHIELLSDVWGDEDG